jgi:hypothetical protein
MYDESNKNILDQYFDKNNYLKQSKNFNKWFNENFEKHNKLNEMNKGYGDWLKSDEGFIEINENVTKTNMNEIFEEKKRQIQSITVYTGVKDIFASNLGGTLLDDNNNYTTDSYTDLRQAYTETLIPVTQEDYNKIQKYNSVNEYKSHRDRMNTNPLSKEESEKLLLKENNFLEQQSAALAFKYAKESELVTKERDKFWGNLKRITG